MESSAGFLHLTRSHGKLCRFRLFSFFLCSCSSWLSLPCHTTHTLLPWSPILQHSILYFVIFQDFIAALLGPWLAAALQAALLPLNDIEENEIVAPLAVPASHAGDLRDFRLRLLPRPHPLRTAIRFPRHGLLMTSTSTDNRNTN